MRMTNAAYIAALSLLCIVIFGYSALELVLYWLDSPEFGHGLILSLVGAYIFWIQRSIWNAIPSKTSVAGNALLILGILMHIAGTLGDIQVAKFYAIATILVSIPISLFGFKQCKNLLFPYVLLIVAIPLHPSINAKLTESLQLISSDIGVWFIRSMGMAALQNGNIIDMGSFVMLVEEACSGLRYLLPLLCLNLLAAYFFKGSFALKTLIVLAAIPVTVFMNSLRIALTGLIIKYYGPEAAQGFLHDFEGVVVFAGACGIMILILVVFSIALGRGANLAHSFSLADLSPTLSCSVKLTAQHNMWVPAILLSIGGIGNAALHFTKQEVIPDRERFAQFPLAIDQRDLYPDTLEDKFLDILKPDDYFIGDFIQENSLPINLYMAYYESQRNGSLIHSPSQCIPAGGWQIAENTLISLKDMGLTGFANRSVIKKDHHRLLVYYWVNQQGNNFATESDVYFSLIKRSIFHSRTDGTLVRVIIPFDNGNEDTAEQQLKQFIKRLRDDLPRFLPE